MNAYLNSARSCGHFVWTGFDYIGEPTEWNKYPAKSSYFGIVDTCGFPKDIYYMYQSMWDSRPMIHILPHWTHESGDINVWLYSNCASVELFLNGKSLGKKTLSQRGTHRREWLRRFRQFDCAGRAIHIRSPRETGTFQRQDGGQYRVG